MRGGSYLSASGQVGAKLPLGIVPVTDVFQCIWFHLHGLSTPRMWRHIWFLIKPRILLRAENVSDFIQIIEMTRSTLKLCGNGRYLADIRPADLAEKGQTRDHLNFRFHLAAFNITKASTAKAGCTC